MNERPLPSAVHSDPADRAGKRARSRSRSRVGRVLIALAVAASVLAVAPSPAQGAAAEVDVRRLEGSTRYETAVEIAETFVDQVEGDSSRFTIDTVILTSGANEHFAYALPAPALSRRYDAPLLLTEPDDLPTAVTTFLTRYDVATVFILGGTSVVSSAVERDIDAISGVEVTRIDGDDEYATAVEVAERVGSSPGTPGEFPGEGRTALLATGEEFADALAVGPLAYRGEHPILLTRSSVLPNSVESFLNSSNTEHVVILGGTAAVSTGVARDVTDLGIEVTRWSGSDRFATAVEIAEALLNIDTPQECFDGSEIGLAYGWRSPDAIVSGPLLGEICAPLLLTELDSLPTVVERFLESDDFVTGDVDGELRFTVFGGRAAVGERAVADAEDAAQLTNLNARIFATEGGCYFTVTFNEPVLTDDAGDITNYLEGNTPLDAQHATVDAGSGRTTTEAVVTFVGATSASGTSVPTGCNSPLRSRDRVGVVGGEIEAASDRRTVSRVEFFVDADRDRPQLTMIAPEGSDMVWVESNEPLQAADIEVVFERSRDSDVSVEVSVTAGATMFIIDVPVELGSELTARDRVSIGSDEVEDLAGNGNRSLSRTVVRDNTAPRVSRITVTQATPRERTSVTLRAPDDHGVSQPSMSITANVGSAADGAAGNEWTFELIERSGRPSSWTSSQVMSVQISSVNERIVVTMLDEARIDDLVDGLNRNTTFRSLFTAATLGNYGGSDPVETSGRVFLEGGKSTVDLTVLWTEPVQGCNAAADPVAPRLIEIDVDADGSDDFALDGYAFGNSDIEFIAGDRQPTSIIAGEASCDTTTPGARSGTLVARVQSSDIDELPSTRSEANIRSGAATDLAGNVNTRQSEVVLKRP